MDIRTFLNTFLHLFNMLLQHVPKFSPHSPPTRTAEITVVEQLQLPPQIIPPVVIDQQNLEYWSRLIFSFCFTSAIEIAFQSIRTSSPLFHALSLAISLAFASLFVAKFIDSSRFPVTARVLERLAIFFAATAFFHAMSIPFPVYIKCITWAVYVISLLTIFICRHCR